jgi:peptide/nickel transport system permease protein
MWYYAIRKFFYGIAVMAGVVVVVFILFNILPGDPARMTLGQRADVQSLEAVRKEFGLDRSRPMQFVLLMICLQLAIMKTLLRLEKSTIICRY